MVALMDARPFCPCRAAIPCAELTCTTRRSPTMVRENAALVTLLIASAESLRSLFPSGAWASLLNFGEHDTTRATARRAAPASGLMPGHTAISRRMLRTLRFDTHPPRSKRSHTAIPQPRVRDADALICPTGPGIAGRETGGK